MIIREIKVSELVDFVQSEDYAQLDVKPITLLRAISQHYNPVASPNDIALVYAAEGNSLLAFAGLMPDKLNGESEMVSGNTGWWVKPGSNHLALPIFLKALEKCNRRMFFTDCTPQTKWILEKTGLFEFLPAVNGERYFLRYCISTVMRRKGKNETLTEIAGAADIFMNSLFSLRSKKVWLNPILKKFSIHKVSAIDEELANFIAEHSTDNIMKQTKQKLNWIMMHSWLTTDDSAPVVKYPFSNKVESYHQQLLVVKKQNELCAVLLINTRDKMAMVPFIFYKKEFLLNISQQIRLYLQEFQAESLVVFNEELRRAMNNNGMPMVYTRKIARYSGYSVELKKTIKKNSFFQDGDGDVAFS